MMHYSRLCTLTFAALTLSAAASAGWAATPSDLLPSKSAQGYLGVGLMDVDADRAAALKLKEARGAEIISIDQDAPAAKAGLKVHDVVIDMNGQRIEGIEQFRRMLHETPSGRTVSLAVIREGQQVSVNAQLADRATVAKGVMVGIGDTPLPSSDSAATTPPAFVPPGSGRHLGSGKSFLEPFKSTRYYVGVDLQPLPTGLAEYFGVRGGSGLLVGNVFPNSPGSAAGLKAADVIQKVNGQPIVSLSDWQRALRANRGKQVQVTVIRDKKEQTLSMVAGEARTTSELMPDSGLDDEETIATLSSATLNDELAGLDAGITNRQVQESLQGLDFEAIQKQARSAVEALDSQVMQKALEQSHGQWQRSGPQLEEQLRRLRESVQSWTTQQMD